MQHQLQLQQRQHVPCCMCRQLACMRACAQGSMSFGLLVSDAIPETCSAATPSEWPEMGKMRSQLPPHMHALLQPQRQQLLPWQHEAEHLIPSHCDSMHAAQLGNLFLSSMLANGRSDDKHACIWLPPAGEGTGECNSPKSARYQDKSIIISIFTYN